MCITAPCWSSALHSLENIGIIFEDKYLVNQVHCRGLCVCIGSSGIIKKIRGKKQKPPTLLINFSLKLWVL